MLDAWGTEHLQEVFRLIFLKKENNVDVMLLTKAYHKYKREYVRHLSFTPEAEHLGKLTILIL